VLLGAVSVGRKATLRRCCRSDGGRPQGRLGFVEKFLTTKLTSADTTERNAWLAHLAVGG
jgi:hypothetical protein